MCSTHTPVNHSCCCYCKALWDIILIPFSLSPWQRKSVWKRLLFFNSCQIRRSFKSSINSASESSKHCKLRKHKRKNIFTIVTTQENTTLTRHEQDLVEIMQEAHKKNVNYSEKSLKRVAGTPLRLMVLLKLAL